MYCHLKLTAAQVAFVFGCSPEQIASWRKPYVDRRIFWTNPVTRRRECREVLGYFRPHWTKEKSGRITYSADEVADCIGFHLEPALRNPSYAGHIERFRALIDELTAFRSLIDFISDE